MWDEDRVTESEKQIRSCDHICVHELCISSYSRIAAIELCECMCLFKVLYRKRNINCLHNFIVFTHVARVVVAVVSRFYSNDSYVL